MKIKNNKIVFYSISKDVEDWSTPPQTGVSSNIPEWFKKLQCIEMEILSLYMKVIII